MRIWNNNLLVASRLLCTRYNSRLYSSTIGIQSMGSDPAIAKALMNGHPNNNLVESIVNKVGRNLHLIDNHPLGIIKNR